MNTQAELVDGVWVVRETDDDGARRTFTLTCEIKVPIADGDGRGLRTCGDTAKYRAITGAGDGSGRNYDERYCCESCKAADEASGLYIVDGKLVEDYGPMYQYEEITADWLADA